jgi:predicted secreted protein
MTIAQFIVAYAVCWWLVLFMVLPSGVAPDKNPTVGNAPSAPANPRLKRKFAWTTLFAILPTLVIYFVATAAKAEDAMYHAGGGCEPLATHSAADDVAARDGYGVGGKKVAPANLDSSTYLDSSSSVNIPLRMPTANYVDASNYNADFSESFASIGDVDVGMDGSTSLNGRPINNMSVYPPDCAPQEETK